MIKHIVSWQLKADDPTQRAKDAEQAKQKLEALQGQIDGLIKIEVGINMLESSGADVCLYSELADANALAHYQTHPAHVEVGGFIKTICQNRHCIDYEV